MPSAREGAEKVQEKEVMQTSMGPVAEEPEKKVVEEREFPDEDQVPI